MSQAFVQAALGETLANAIDGERRDLDLLGNSGIFVRAAVFGFVGEK